MEEKLPFPMTIFVSHYEHSTAESPSLNVNLTELESVDENNKAIEVAEYHLVKTRVLIRRVEEVR
jgi:hypothetical protein